MDSNRVCCALALGGDAGAGAGLLCLHHPFSSAYKMQGGNWDGVGGSHPSWTNCTLQWKSHHWLLAGMQLRAAASYQSKPRLPWMVVAVG